MNKYSASRKRLLHNAIQEFFTPSLVTVVSMDDFGSEPYKFYLIPTTALTLWVNDENVWGLYEKIARREVYIECRIHDDAQLLWAITTKDRVNNNPITLMAFKRTSDRKSKIKRLTRSKLATDLYFLRKAFNEQEVE